MKNTFYISCPIDTYSGYGARSRDFVKALIELDKYEVIIVPQRWGDTRWGFINDHKEEWGYLKDHFTKTPKPPQQPDIWCQVTVPNEFQPIGKYNIGLTAGIETTACAPQWIVGCNRMDLILTSSEHSKNVFEKTSYSVQDKRTNQNGTISLQKPVKVLFEGADLNIYKPLKSTELKNKELYNTLKSIPEDFAYLFVGHWIQGDLGEDRKNVSLLIKAFYEVFKGKKKVPALVLKTCTGTNCHMDRREILRRLNTLRESVPSNFKPNVYLVHGDLSDEEMNELYNHPKIKAMVSFTKGEGFGRPLLEFSLTNKPIISSNWSGQIDFLHPEFTSLVGGELKKVHKSSVVKDIILAESEWFSPNHGEIGGSMINMFEDYKNWKAKGKRQGFHARSNFSFEKMKELLSSILEESVPEIAKQVPLSLPKLKLPKLKKV